MTSRGAKEKSLALYSVAFQDHYLRALGDPSATLLSRIPRGKTKKPVVVRATVDTGLRKYPEVKKPTAGSAVRREYVLDEKPPAPTLAQKLGLIEAPRGLMNERDWSEVKKTAVSRESFLQPCPICQDSLGTTDQVLLSCTHVFHKHCILAFERYAGKKCCPLCREREYQTRVVHDARAHYKTRCATKIQACWRGHLVRCWYRNLRKTVPPQDPKLRQVFYEQRFSDITDRLVRSCDFDINSFFRELEHSVEASRGVFLQFERFQLTQLQDWDAILERTSERGDENCPICLVPLWLRDTETDQSTSKASASSKPAEGETSKRVRSTNGTGKQQKKDAKSFTTSSRKTVISASSRIPSSTPVDASLASDSCNATSKSNDKTATLLSCSHVFHSICLSSFEKFAPSEGEKTCPVCRSLYAKIQLSGHFKL